MSVRKKTPESIRIVSKFGELIWKALQIWRADLDSSPNWDMVSFLLLHLMWVCSKFVGSQSGVCQESISSVSGVWWWPNLQNRFVRLSKLRPGVISNKFLLLGLMWVCPKSVGNRSRVNQESVRSQSGVSQESHGNQIWRADFNSSQNWDLVSSPSNFCCWVQCESVWSLSGVSQESVRSQ